VLAGGTVSLNSAANVVRNVAIDTTAGNVAFSAVGPLSVLQVVGGRENPRVIAGVSTISGNVTLRAGILDLAAPVTAGSDGTVELTATDGAIGGSETGVVSGGALRASATNGINLHTRVAAITGLGNATSGDITITNNSATAPGTLTASDIDNSASGGKVTLDNYGATTIAGNGVHASGDIGVTAHSPLTVNGPVTSDSGSIALEAAASGGQDELSINSAVTATKGNISLKAGSSITGDGTVSAPNGTVSRTPLPTIAQCIATPGLAGCSSVLPTLAVCTAAPATSGCSVVLPTIAACTANPTQAGCSAVLPFTQPDQAPAPVLLVVNNLARETNPTTTTTQSPTGLVTVGSGSSGGQQSGGENTQDDKKDGDKKQENGSSQSNPEKQNEIKKNKQYCN
jgi:hypothetical protein